MESKRILLESVNQQHILKFYQDLDKEQQEHLEKEIANVDWRELDCIYKTQVLTHFDGQKPKPTARIDESLIQALPESRIGGTLGSSENELENYKSIGLKAIQESKVAVILLAGGQGTRLGVDYPKGMYDVGLASRKTLFQLQAERIIEIRDLAKNASSTGETTSIIWYIMTSEATMESSKKFFQEASYFGLDPSEVVFFEQNTIPSLSFDGKVLLSEKHRISRSPNGNGGLYEALHQRKIIDDMLARSVEFVHVYCVDNVLVRVCDPAFIGYCIEKQADAGAKVVEKKSPGESVGTICRVGNQFKVIEYSEISDAVASKRDPKSGKLMFRAGNICEHFFKLDFLKTICGDRTLRYHLAIKKIPCISLETGAPLKSTEPNGIKLERFIFDVFELTDNFVVWEVKREDEFSPLKNADGTERDNPTTARESLRRAYELNLLKV